MQDLLADVRFALRQMLRRPAASALLVTILALGIGTTGAMLAVVKGVLVSDLPFRDPNRLVALFAPQPAIPDAPFSGPDFLDQQAQTQSFDAMAAVSPSNASLVVGEQAVMAGTTLVTGDFFKVLGIQPALGRLLDADDASNDRHVAVISDRLFRERFGGEPSAVGTTVSLGGQPFEVVGVLGPGQRFGYVGGSTDVWVPLPLTAAGASPIFTERGAHGFFVFGRLRDGVSIEAARADLAAVAARLEEAHPQTNTRVGAAAIPLKERIVGDSQKTLVFLLGAIAAVLLLACVNVANILLAHGAARRGELAMRAALGASRGRIVRQLLTESIVLGLLGGGLGLLVALWALDAFVGFFEPSIPATVLSRVHLDPASMALTMLVALVAGAAAGIAPAIAASRPDSYEVLKESAARATPGARRHLVRNALVVAEVAIAIVLLSGAGLLIKSFARLSAVDPGFDSERVFVAQVALPSARFGGHAQVVGYQEQTIAHVRGAPGVLSTGVIDRLPQGDWNTNGDIVIDGQPPFGPSESPVVERRRATPDYFRTMGIRVVAGRPFSELDGPSNAPVMIVNEAFARRFFPGQDAIGKRARWNTDQLPLAEIVGVVADVKSRGPDRGAALESYLPFAQHSDQSFTFVAKVAPGVDGAEILRAALRQVDPLQPAIRIEPMTATTDKKVAGRKSLVHLLGAFAAAAVILAALGIYGVVSHQTSQRTREVGIRLALGARPRDVVALVVFGSMRVVAAGLVAGVCIALALSGVLGSFLFETSAFDPLVYMGVAASVAAVGLAASAVPAWRAAAVAPATALRYE